MFILFSIISLQVFAEQTDYTNLNTMASEQKSGESVNTHSPPFPVTLINEEITYIKLFSLDETDLNRQHPIVPEDDGTLNMPNNINFRSVNQGPMDPFDSVIQNIHNSSWKLKEAPSGYTISPNETAADFDATYPAGDYIYEFVIDPDTIYTILFSSPSKLAFATYAQNKSLPIRKVIWAKGEQPIYNIIAFNALSPEVATQIFAKGDNVSTIKMPDTITATVTDSLSDESKILEIPVTWNINFDRNTIGNFTHTVTLPTEYDIYKLTNINNVVLPTITTKVKDITFTAYNTHLPSKQYYAGQSLINIHEFNPTTSILVDFEEEISKPYLVTKNNFNLQSIKNSDGNTITLDPINPVFTAPGTYIFTYSTNGFVKIFREIWKISNFALDGRYVKYLIQFNNPIITLTQVVNVIETPANGDVIRFSEEKYNHVDGYFIEEFVDVGKPLSLSANSLLNLNSLEVFVFSTDNYSESKVSKDIIWVDKNGLKFDINKVPKLEPGVYTFTAQFTETLRSGTLTPLSNTITMPYVEITVFDNTDPSKRLAPKYGDGTALNPFIYYLDLHDTRVLTDMDGNDIHYEKIYKNVADTHYNNGVENLMLHMSKTGSYIKSVTAHSVGSDPLVITQPDNKHLLSTHAWVYVVDDAQAPRQTNAESGGWTTDSTTSLPEHSIHVDKYAAWTADGADTANITFDIYGKEVAIPRNSDVLLIADNSGSMATDNHWDDMKIVLEGFSEIIFSADDSNPHNNRIAFVSFGDDTTGSFNFLNNNKDFINKINELTIPSKYVQTSYTAGLAQGMAFLESRTGETTKRPLFIIFFTDGDSGKYYDGLENYRANFEATDNRNFDKLDSMIAVRQSITIHHTNDFLRKFNNTDFGVDEYIAGEGLDKYYDYAYQMLSNAENTVITDVIDTNYEVIEAELPANATLSRDIIGVETVTINLGRINPKERVTVNIPIKLKESSKPKDDTIVTYPTNNGAKATYENFLYQKKLIDDTFNTAEADRIGKPELSYPGTINPIPPNKLDVPSTGDNSRIVIWFVLLFASGIGIRIIHTKKIRQ